jgi:hypothetical protein
VPTWTTMRHYLRLSYILDMPFYNAKWVLTQIADGCTGRRKLAHYITTLCKDWAALAGQLELEMGELEALRSAYLAYVAARGAAAAAAAAGEGEEMPPPFDLGQFLLGEEEEPAGSIVPSAVQQGLPPADTPNDPSVAYELASPKPIFAEVEGQANKRLKSGV